MPSRITMEDVAERAGVSVTTVSHVVNATRPVSDELRQRVLAAMEALGYRPNLLARSLRRGHTHTVGIILPDNVNPFFAEVARGVEDEAFAHGYSVILCNTDGNVEKEGFYATLLAEKRVDGILFVAAGGGTEPGGGLVARGVACQAGRLTGDLCCGRCAARGGGPRGARSASGPGADR